MREKTYVNVVCMATCMHVVAIASEEMDIKFIESELDQIVDGIVQWVCFP